MINDILETILLCLLFAVCITVYSFLMSSVLPRYVLRVKYNVHDILGRGLKRFVYPDGRAVVYEPHPSVRKYVNKYALFTIDGYKYICLSVDNGVRKYTASVVMMDNRGRVIDALDISELTGGATSSSPVKLHDRTSYVALSVSSVNDMLLDETVYARTSAVYAALYGLAVMALTLLQFVQIYYSVEAVCSIFRLPMPITAGIEFFILPSVLIAFVCTGIALLFRVRRGIKVVLK